VKARATDSDKTVAGGAGALKPRQLFLTLGTIPFWRSRIFPAKHPRHMTLAAHQAEGSRKHGQVALVRAPLARASAPRLTESQCRGRGVLPMVVLIPSVGLPSLKRVSVKGYVSLMMPASYPTTAWTPKRDVA